MISWLIRDGESAEQNADPHLDLDGGEGGRLGPAARKRNATPREAKIVPT